MALGTTKRLETFGPAAGSEVRVLIAVLRQMDDELTHLETRLNYLWEKP